MSTHRSIDKICCIVLALMLVLTILLMNADRFSAQQAEGTAEYETALFDTSKVHTIDLIMDDWDDFIDTCSKEEYAMCSALIDDELFENIAIRAKGNTSLTQVKHYNSDRYSFKIEFDHYNNANDYHGLDKLNLNNMIQDNTYMKDYLTYQMMRSLGVDAPLCSFVRITVNGEEWGLYLAIEGVEESFLERNYGTDYGALYKPDNQSGNSKAEQNGNFHAEKQPEGNAAGQENRSVDEKNRKKTGEPESRKEAFKPQDDPPEGFAPTHTPQDNIEPPNHPMPEENSASDAQSDSQTDKVAKNSDVALLYSDDAFSSYQNIFDNAKTEITNADKKRLIASLKQLKAKENIEAVVEVDAVIRYFVVHNFVCNFDSYTGSLLHNYYLYEDNGKLSMIPWDYNLAFGGFSGAQDATALVNYPIDSPVSGGALNDRPMLNWIFSKEQYTTQYHQYFAEFIDRYFNSGAFSTMIDETRALIAPYVKEDPSNFCTYSEFETGVSTLKKFCLLRAESIEGQLDGDIASTSDGQMTNKEDLVDASALDIGDMGTMHGNNR